MDVDEARDIAAARLNPLGRRWTHVRAVAARAAEVAVTLPPAERPVVVVAAWLHDIGYAPALADTGFHPLDGARWLRARGCDARIAALVAHHTYARYEADLRGLDLGEFPREDSATADALAYADLTTGPDGQSMDVRARIAEVYARYGEDHVVSRAWRVAAPHAYAMADAFARRPVWHDLSE